jgi:hypothetical protein
VSTKLRLFIWEGNGISSAYHDDGTLVILAESPEQAREVVAKARRSYAAKLSRTRPARDEQRARMDAYIRETPGMGASRWETPKGKALSAEQAQLTVPEPGLPDGENRALLRAPDRVVDLTHPTIVAFNGGGYD